MCAARIVQIAIVLVLFVLGCSVLSALVTTTPTPAAIAPATPSLLARTDTQQPTSNATRLPTRTPIPIANPYSQVVAGEPLSVTTTLPGHKATGIAVAKKDTVISVQFNHPVVPLVAIEAQQELPEPLVVIPQVSGQGKWVNTSTYAFILDQDLQVATRYIVSVQSLTDLLGQSLRAYAWSFETESPQVVAMDPPDKGDYVSVKKPITMTFNTPMDVDSVRARLSVERSTGQMPVSGQIVTAANVVYFVPDGPLSYGTRYVVDLQAGAQNAIHTALTERTAHWTFETSQAPGVTTDIKDGAKDVQSGYRNFMVKFNSPMDRHGIQYKVDPPLSYSNFWYSDYEPDKYGFTGSINGFWQPSQPYTVTIQGNSLTRYGEELGKDVVVHFTTAPISSNAYTIMPGAVVLYDANGSQIVYTRHVNSNEINYSLYSIDSVDLLRLLAESQTEWELPAQARLVREWSQSVPSELNATHVVTTTLKRRGEPQPPGAYYLEVGVDEGVTQSKILFISELNLTLKRTETEALVWVTDLQTGKPVADQPLTLYSEDGVPLAEGRSDQDGIWRTQFPHVDSYATVWVLSWQDTHVVAAVSDNWNDEIGTWDFDLNFERTSQDLYASLYTDRAIYRPGQSVYFKGILRRDHDVDYELPADIEKVPVRAYNSQGVQVFAQDIPLSRFGTFNGEIKLSDSAATGNYRIAIELGEQKRKSIRTTPFLVAAYRPPDYFVTVKTEEPAYISGDKIKTDVDASYFFGGSVGNATVRWLVESDGMYFRPPNVQGDWEFQDYTRFNHDTVRQGEGKTDAQGKFHLDVLADLAHYSTSQSFTLQAEITDINNQAISNRVEVPVHRGKFYIGVRPERYIGVVGQKQNIEAITVDPQGITVTRQSLVASIYHRRWFSTLHRDADGYFSWESTYTETLASEINLTTNARGYASTPFVPKAGGAYLVIVQGKDDIGNPIRSATYFWVSDSDFVDWEMKNNDRIELIADKKEYAPGDVAEIMIPAPFKEAEALLTIERGTIRDVRRLTLNTNSERVRIPIQSDYAPNIFVSVVLVKGRGADSPISQFKMGYIKLSVSRAEKALDVKVTADRTTPYRPGEKATFTIQATDHAGKGVEAEFSVALVDKAVQSLADDRSVPPLDAFYGERGLAVQTAVTLVRSVDRVNYDLQTGKKGGGGGYAVTTTRRDFRDTAFWQADAVTDPSGRAQVTIPLPDNLTTWNLTAKGVTAATQVGVASTDILSTKKFLLRPVTPRFFVVGDKVRLEAVVHNNTAQEVRAKAQLDTQGLTLRSDAEQPLTLPPRGKAKVSWDVTVNAVERAVVRFNALGGELQDAVELTLPVYRPIASETVATAGQIETQVAERIELPKTIDPSAGELKIELSPSLAAASRSGLRYLESYAYDCVEQVTSKFLPNVASYLALKVLGIERADLKQNLEINVQRETQRLNALQHRDGGWGWWWDGESDPSLTAYALFGLHTAKKAGFTVDQAVMDHAEDYLMRYLDESIDPAARLAYNQRAFVIFVLTEMERPMTGRAVSLFEQRARLGNYGKAWLLMALDRLEQPQVSVLRAELTSKAIVSATGAHWEETGIDYWTMNTNTRSTALAIMALARTDPKNMTLPSAVRWLMTARKKGHWDTTQETAWSVLALTEFMRSTGELQGNYHFQATLNDKAIGEGIVNAASVDQSTALQVAVKDMLQSTANTLILSRDSGDGRLYYSAYLNYYLPAENVPAVNQGILVTRQYEAVDPNTLRPTGKSIESAKVGDYVRVTLTIIAPNDLHYLALEDPLPAGFEAVDRSLNTANIAAHAPTLQAMATARNWFKPYWEYWTHSEVHDDRVVAFATYLEHGTYQYSYLARASITGEFRVLPARAWEMYFPEVFGHSSGAMFAVKGE